MSWFSYDPDDGFELHDTRDGAKRRAESLLGVNKARASSHGWPDDVADICYGLVQAQVIETKSMEIPDDVKVNEDGIGDDGEDYSAVHFSEWDVIQWFDFENTGVVINWDDNFTWIHNSSATLECSKCHKTSPRDGTTWGSVGKGIPPHLLGEGQANPPFAAYICPQCHEQFEEQHPNWKNESFLELLDKWIMPAASVKD